MNLKDYVKKCVSNGTLESFAKRSGSTLRFVKKLVYEARDVPKAAFLVGLLKASDNQVDLHDLNKELFGMHQEGVENLKAMKKAVDQSLREAKKKGLA